MAALRQNYRNARRLRWRSVIAATLLLWVPAPRAANPAPTVTREQELKAAALYNIIEFTEWPATAFRDANAPLVVGVVGSGPISNLLKDLVENETWHGRMLVLEYYPSLAQVKNCHVLYVGKSDQDRWPLSRTQFIGRPILTVSDADTFARNAGIVQLGIERNRLKLTVNLVAARASGLTISSKVLRLAEVIGDNPQ